MALNLVRLRVISCENFPLFKQLASQQHYSTDLSTEAEPSRKFPSVATHVSGIKRGTGGRSSFSGKVVTVFGATGFVGRYLVNQLGKIGSQVVIPYRADAMVVRRLKLCGDLGQILFMPFCLKDEEDLYKAMKHSNVVVNLIGRSFETKNFPFEEVHVKAARNIARIAKESGVQTLIHFSSLNVSEHPTPHYLKKGSRFLQSKWHGENAVREEFPEAVIFRPADMFANDDNFLRYYAGQIRHTYPYLSLWKKGNKTIKQPVFVSDVAKAIVQATVDADAEGKIYQAIGPHRYELGELLDWCHRVMQKDENYKRLDINFDPVIWIKVAFQDFFYKRPWKLSFERLEREFVTDEIHTDLLTLEDLGVKLTTLEDRIFHDLKMFRACAYHDPMLSDYIRYVDPAPFAKS